MTPSIPRWLRAALASAALVAAVTGAIALFEPRVPALGLGVLYVVAVVPIALAYGSAVAAGVSVASVLAFSYFLVPPKHSLDPGTPERWSVLVAFLTSSLIVGHLAARSQREARRSARLAAEQAALQRVATLVAHGVPPPDVFAAIAREVGQLLGVSATHMGRYEPDGTVTVVSAWSRPGAHLPVGTRLRVDGTSVAARVLTTGRPARTDRYDHAYSDIAATARKLGIRTSAGAPIVVDGSLWGVMIASSNEDDTVAEATEARIAAFTELAAAAISSTEARTETARLADEQAALRRVATLVARGVRPGDLFRAATEEAGTLLGADFAGLARHETDHTATVLAAWAATGEHPDVEARRPLEEGDLAATVWRTGRPARMDGDDGYPPDRAARREKLGIRSSVAGPIVVEGRPWGALSVHSTDAEPLPAHTESRLMQFTELVATAMANAQARSEVERLADEQAALRRVATLIARAAPSEEFFDAVSKEAGTLLGADLAGVSRYEDDDTMTILAPWSAAGGHLDAPGRVSLEGATLPRTIRDTGRPAREDAWDEVAGEVAELARDQLGVRSAVGSPIVVEGRVWGALFVSSTQSPHLPGDTESRLESFAELVATAIANTQARADVQRLVDEQRALRRVATFVARGASQVEVFTAIAEEIGQLLGSDVIRILRYEDDRSGVVVASSGEGGDVSPVGSRLRLEGQDVASRVLRTGRPARIEHDRTASGPIADSVRSTGIRSIVGTPIVVEGRLWGAMLTGTTDDEPLPPDTEARLGQFTELMATAIANTESQATVERLAVEQAALRRVATLVARGVPPAEIFAAVSEEVGRLFGKHAGVVRFESDGSAIVFVGVARTLEGLPVGTRWDLDDSMASAEVYRTGRSARVDAMDWSSRSGSVAEAGQRMGVVSTIASPIIVEGRRWGAVTVVSLDEPLPFGVEERLDNFTELVATAIANAESREARGRLADEQAALRRVATLVAEGASPTAILDAVAAEMEALLDADQVALNRFELGAEISVLAHRGLDVARTPVGSRVSNEGESATALVRRTGRPARVEHYEGAPGALAELARDTGLRFSVGAPIVVDGRLWGIITASWKGEDPPPADTEARMARFAQLLDTAIANADSRDQLTASRARLVTAADEARRRVVRDLHDGAQQRMVHTIITLKLALKASREKDERAESLIGQALEHAEQGNAALRELAHGILPAVLTRGGLRAGVDAVVMRLDLPVSMDVPGARFAAEIEASAYFVVAEALTNVVKHAQAGRAEVRGSVEDGMLHLEVRDDGIGGADPQGHGLVGMADRVTALGGRLQIDSPSGGGTLVAATLPIAAD